MSDEETMILILFGVYVLTPSLILLLRLFMEYKEGGNTG